MTSYIKSFKIFNLFCYYFIYRTFILLYLIIYIQKVARQRTPWDHGYSCSVFTQCNAMLWLTIYPIGGCYWKKDGLTRQLCCGKNKTFSTEMATQKPVEWVSSLIIRFEEQVRLIIALLSLFIRPGIETLSRSAVRILPIHTFDMGFCSCA